MLIICVLAFIGGLEVQGQTLNTTPNQHRIEKGQTIQITEGITVRFGATHHKHRMDGGVDGSIQLNITTQEDSLSIRLSNDQVGEWAIGEQYIRVTPEENSSDIVVVETGKRPKAISIDELEQQIIFPERCGSASLSSATNGVVLFRSQKGCTVRIGEYSHRVISEEFSPQN